MNCDDDLVPQVPEILTISSYGRILAQCMYLDSSFIYSLTLTILRGIADA